MKNLSKWLLAGSVLAMAFGCQPKQESEKKNDNSDQKKDCGCSQQSAVPVSKPSAESQKSSVTAPAAEKKQVPVAQQVVEKKAVVAPVVPVSEQKAGSAGPTQAARETAPAQTALTENKSASNEVSSSSLCQTASPEAKAEAPAKTAAPVSQSEVSENQSIK